MAIIMIVIYLSGPYNVFVRAKKKSNNPRDRTSELSILLDLLKY